MGNVAASSDCGFYLAAAKRAPELGREEEAELARRWKLSGDPSAANALAHAHQRHVVATAMKYRNYGVPVGELVAEGNLGVVRALAKFQPERGFRFATYANYWVRAHMLAHVIKSYSTVADSGGPLRSQVFFKLRRERVRVTNLFGVGDAADQRLAGRMGVSLERVRDMVQRLDSRDVSIDAHPTPEGSKLLDRLQAAEDQAESLSRSQVDAGLRHAVAEAIATLDPRERYIAQQRLMADPSDELSLTEIGRRLNVSRERARQLEARTKRKLRSLITTDRDPIVIEWIATELPPLLAAVSPVPKSKLKELASLPHSLSL